MIKKLLALLLALCLMTGGFTLVALAADGDSDLVLIFEENFEEYQKDVNVSSTLMPNFFVCDANSIGDGIIHVQEATDGNLYLKSHVFTQIYSATPIVGAYELSLDIFVAQGTKQTGVFIRAPKTNAAYYEADQYPETSVCQAGLFLYTRGDKLGVNVKTYDATADKNAFLQNNTVEFPLPAGTAHPYTLRVVDANNEIQIYVNGTLMCRVTYADPGKTYAKHESTGKFYGSAKLFDAQGNEKGSYTDPLLSSDGSYVGWTTRVADMVVDNISVKAEAAYQALLAINKLPSKVTEKNIEDVKELAATAKKYGIYLVAGSIPETDGGKLYNTAFVFDPEGKRIARHRKMHLFDIAVDGGQHFKESDTLTAGRDVTVFDTEFGKIGLCICYDIRFPELARLMALAGARAILVPAAFNMTTGPAHWELTFRARALDNQVFYFGTSPSRDLSASYHAWGHTIAVDPWGKVLAQMEEGPGMQTVEVCLDQVEPVRLQLPLLAHRRTDLYDVTRI